jgi:hypothetical protein
MELSTLSERVRDRCAAYGLRYGCRDLNKPSPIADVEIRPAELGFAPRLRCRLSSQRLA